MVENPISEVREHPFGELPQAILSIIENFVEYSERYFDCEEISGNGKSISNLREKWNNCNNDSSKFDLFNKIHQYGSKWYNEFDSHIEKSVWFSRIVPDMFRNMFNQMHKKVQKLIHLAPVSLIQKYPNLLKWAESNKQLNVKVKALEGLDSLLNDNKNKDGLRLSDVSELFNTLKKYRNAVEHRNDFLLIHGNEDKVVPVTRMYNAQEILKDKVNYIDTKVYNSLEHSINDQGLKAGCSFIQKRLNF